MGRAEGVEARVREAWEGDDLRSAATLALDAYGREVLAFLMARLGEQQGNEVFSVFLEDFWRGLPAFTWRSSLRSWAYVLARHAVSRHLRSVRRKRETPFDGDVMLSALIARVRSDTAAHFRSDIKSRFRELRMRLSDDDQTLLILRVDRQLSFREIAAVMAEPGVELDAAALDKHATRLRQRFQTAKDRLRKLAEEEGLLDDPGTTSG